METGKTNKSPIRSEIEIGKTSQPPIRPKIKKRKLITALFGHNQYREN